MNYIDLQNQYDKIYSFFKTTTEPFDFLDWDGAILCVWYNNSIVEIYKHSELKKIILGFLWKICRIKILKILTKKKI